LAVFSIGRAAIRGDRCDAIAAMAGQKGGNGKTTVAICIADELHRPGSHLLLRDVDPQGIARTWVDVAADPGHDTPTNIRTGEAFHHELPALRGPAHDVL
jgi:cellulose biosynthesis protein BcsQ